MQTQMHKVRDILASLTGLRNNDEKVKEAAQTIASLYGEKDIITTQIPERNDELNTLLDELERGLRINIYPRTEEVYNLARKMIKDGQPVSTWLNWYKSDEFRLQSMSFMTVVKVWQMWTSAKPEIKPATTPTTPPRDETRYTPAPTWLKQRSTKP